MKKGTQSIELGLINKDSIIPSTAKETERDRQSKVEEMEKTTCWFGNPEITLGSAEPVPGLSAYPSHSAGCSSRNQSINQIVSLLKFEKTLISF